MGVVLLGALTVVAAPGCQRPENRESRFDDERGLRQEDFVVRAEEALDVGDREEAVRLLAAAIEQNPTLTVAYVKLGDLEMEAGDYTEAERLFSEAARQQPREFDHQYKHGLALHFLNRLRDAVRAYLRALALRPDDFDGNLNLSTAYLQLNEAAQSLPYARRAVNADPQSGRARANLGAVLSSLGRHDEAVMAYQAAAELMELTPELLLNLATSLGRLERYAEMLNTLERARELEPTAATWERVGFARFKLRDYDGAQAAFRRAVDTDASHYPALNGLGVCLLNDWITTGRENKDLKREAIGVLRRSLRLNSRQPRIVELVSRYG